MNYNSEEKIFYIVDGQQRLSCISQFYENVLKLSEKFSGKSRDGKTFNGNNPLEDDDKNDFLNYYLNFHVMEDYDDERVRLIFSRLQRGKPLALGERLNAEPGTIVGCMRELAKHSFLSESIGVAKNRYGIYPDSARILFYEKFGAKQCGSQELYNFFDNFKNLDIKSREFKNATTILNFLEKCFPSKPGNYKHLEKHAWVLAVYTMVRELKLSYSLVDQEDQIRKFIIDFHSKIYNEDFRKSKPNYQRFYDNIRGGWSEKIIALRRDILIKEFLAKFPIAELDDKRQIADEDKIAIFATKKTCELCNCDFKDYKDAEYHHKERYADGGRSKIENIMILCTKCHDRIHGNSELEIPLKKKYQKKIK
ncbi:MAG: HNH endonuclease [Saprospiraceae bacterium]|nr:HNH endonuclease [Saprospiraceae bacterium]